MRYESSAAFRRALEDRLRRQSLESGTPLVRLVTAQPDAWVLKGSLDASLPADCSPNRAGIYGP